MPGLDTRALQRARLAKRLTQERLSEILDIEQPTYQRWETGLREPRSLAMLNTICNVLGVSADVLLGREKFPSARFLADVIRDVEPTLEGDLPERIAGAIHRHLRDMTGAVD